MDSATLEKTVERNGAEPTGGYVTFPFAKGENAVTDLGPATKTRLQAINARFEALVQQAQQQREEATQTLLLGYFDALGYDLVRDQIQVDPQAMTWRLLGATP